MFRMVLSLVLLAGVIPAAANAQPKAKSAAAKLLRIGGQFRVTTIEKLKDDEFRIRFVSEPRTGKNDQLVLHSDHVHMSLQEGQVLRISGEVVQDKGSELEVTQVLLFLPNDHGTTPIWLLSSHYVTDDFQGARWLEMHAPQADYLIL